MGGGKGMHSSFRSNFIAVVVNMDSLTLTAWDSEV